MKQIDLQALYVMTPTGVIDAGSDSRKRLMEAQLIDETGHLTVTGTEVYEKLRETVARLKSGVPVEQRKKSDASAAEKPYSTQLGWVSGVYSKKAYITNGAIFILGHSEKSMEAKEADPGLRHALASLLQKHLAGKPEDFVQIEPKVYQIADLGGMEFIWLADEKNELRIPVQSMYVDMIKARYPSATFWVHGERFKSGKYADCLMLARVTNRGIKNNVVALVIGVVGVSVPELLKGDNIGDML